MSFHNKTIWYCHHYAGSPSLGMSFRPYYLAKEFSKAGHQAYVIAASYHHLKQDRYTHKKPVEARLIDQVNYIFLKTCAYKKNGIFRIINMLQYAFQFFYRSKTILAQTGKPDVIIASSTHPFHYLPLEKLAKRYGATLIFEVRDLWPLSLIKLLNVPKWHPLVITLGLIEKRAYRRADYVVSLLNKALPYMESKGLIQSKFRVISNGVSIETFAEGIEDKFLPQALDRKIAQLKKEGYFLVGYTGAMGKPNALDYLIEAMRILRSRNVFIHCILVGQGELKKDLQALAAELDNISFVNPIKEGEIPVFLKKMDVHYIGWNPSDLYEYGISPNKIFYYMTSGKPIVESCAPSAGLVDLFQCGLSCEPGKPEAIAHAIETISTLSPETLNTMGAKGKEAVMKHYDYSVLAKQYMNLFD